MKFKISFKVKISSQVIGVQEIQELIMETFAFGKCWTGNY